MKKTYSQLARYHLNIALSVTWCLYSLMCIMWDLCLNIINGQFTHQKFACLHITWDIFVYKLPEILFVYTLPEICLFTHNPRFICLLITWDLFVSNSFSSSLNFPDSMMTLASSLKLPKYFWKEEILFNIYCENNFSEFWFYMYINSKLTQALKCKELNLYA